MKPGRVLYVGQAFYHAWYLSRALRERGWKADVMNWDAGDGYAAFYHGEDMRLRYRGRLDAVRHGALLLKMATQYDVFHFSNMHGLRFGHALHDAVARFRRPGDEVRLLKRLGKPIVYSNNGCLDGVSQTSFGSWGPHRVCDDCVHRNDPSFCSDEGNLRWGRMRNDLADFQCLAGGNRIDCNIDPRIHEVPEFNCMDPELWRPDLEIPATHRLDLPSSTVKLYHAVGNARARTEPGRGATSSRATCTSP